MNDRARLLEQYLGAAPARAFDWAAWNCCHFAAGWVRAVCGWDPMHGLPATPAARDAVRLVRRLGGSLAAAWTRQLGAQPLPAAMAQLGDLVLLPVPLRANEAADARTGHAVGICAGLSVVACTDAGDFAFVPMSEATAAWRLPARRASA